VRNRATGLTTRVSVSSTGARGNEQSFSTTISADGRFVAFGSFASNPVPDDTNVVRELARMDRSLHTLLMPRVSQV
jgi:hypothetical protein